MLPSNPTAENVPLSCIKANVATSVHQLLPTLPSIGKRDASSFEKPQTKVKSTVKRLLPNIPMPEKLSLPSIEPTVVKAQLKGCSRRQRFLPSVPVLPTIKRQLSPVLEEMEATTEGVHTAEGEQTKGVHPVETAQSKVHSPPEGNMLQSREMKQKDNSLFDPNEEAVAPKAALESAGEERPPNQNDYLPENYRTKRIETKQKPKKITKGNQKCFEEQIVRTATPSSTCGKPKLGKRGRFWRHLDRKTSFTRHSVRQRKRDEGKISSITAHDRERPYKCSTERQKTAV
ncbi:unnamed protein product [Pocillopora meandrina]|uniref:Uncharacterized protein n=1 Tax=Pocillopora meandrina TaxID=46732 RepID=A0AAU9W1M5_9CNID|nr:unnamed protein product [Pocillopora meandrina]